MKTVLIENGTGTETGDTKGSVGGDAIFTFVGTFDSSTCGIEFSANGTNWSPMHDSTGSAIAITAETQDVYAVNVKQELSVRATISGGGGSTDITITIIQ